MEASPRQRKAAKLLLGKKAKSMKDAMLQAGYSESYSRVPQHLKKKKTWRDLMDSLLSEERLAKVHSDQLEAEDAYGNPDNTARLRAVDMAYKLRGSYAPEQTTVIMRKFGEMTDEELDEAIREADRKVRKKD